MAANPVTGTFTADGQSASVAVRGPYSVTIWGTFAATVVVERSYDDGATWHPKTPAEVFSLTAACSFDDEEPGVGVLYRLNCDWTSGTVNYRVSF